MRGRFFRKRPPRLPEAGTEPPTPLFAPPGHFYSPVVDRDALRAGGFQARRMRDTLPGLALDIDAMAALFERLMVHYDAADFPEQASKSHRYHYQNDQYTYGDAIILSAMLRTMRPARYIEAGSGFSSAVALDTFDRMPDHSVACTFIEPYPTRLEGLLRPSDASRVRIIRQDTQDVPVEIFDELQAGDILFLDTTHIVKTGSDVVHEVFQILPRLASGVIVHFHDVFADFDYPDIWIFEENRSWNEQYLLRAFLMYNQAFEIIYANHWFFTQRREMLRDRCPLIARNAGGGLWLRKR